MTIDISHDEQRHKFSAVVGGQEAYLRYVRAGGQTLRYTTTFVPPQHRNRGIGERLVRHALAYARDHGFEVVPTCSFVRRVMDESPE